MSHDNVYASPSQTGREASWVDLPSWAIMATAAGALSVPVAPFAVRAMSMMGRSDDSDPEQLFEPPPIPDAVAEWLIPVVSVFAALLVLAVLDAGWRRPGRRIGVLRGVIVGAVSVLLLSGWLGAVWRLGGPPREILGGAVFATLLGGLTVSWVAGLLGGFVALVHDRVRRGEDPVASEPTPASPSS